MLHVASYAARKMLVIHNNSCRSADTPLTTYFKGYESGTGLEAVLVPVRLSRGCGTESGTQRITIIVSPHQGRSFQNTKTKLRLQRYRAFWHGTLFRVRMKRQDGVSCSRVPPAGCDRTPQACKLFHTAKLAALRKLPL